MRKGVALRGELEKLKAFLHKVFPELPETAIVREACVHQLFVWFY